MQGFTVLTDPIFSERTDPWPMGVARHTPPPCGVEDLPEIDVCVISHDHYDHLDQSSVEELKDKVHYWAVPLGMSEWLQDYCDIPQEHILEMTWWESKSLERNDAGDLQVTSTLTDSGALELVCAPAQHWCGRNMLDRNQRLWCSWVVRAGPLKFFFAGDTALPDSFPLHRYVWCQKEGDVLLSLCSLSLVSFL
jgi:L-ascorbate metabolism protein UlaG (beta-lactamase superfamily)